MNRCLTDEKIEQLVRSRLDGTGEQTELPETLHADTCARCSSRVALLSAFLGGNEGLSPDELDRAGSELDSAIERFADPVPANRTKTSPFRRGTPRLIRWALPLAAVLVIGFGIGRFANDPGTSGPSGVLRGETGTPGVTRFEVTTTVGGQVTLEWTAGIAVREYRVVWLGDDLGPLGDPAVTTQNRYELPLTGIPEGATLVRIESVLRDGSVQRTAPTPLPLESSP